MLFIWGCLFCWFVFLEHWECRDDYSTAVIKRYIFAYFGWTLLYSLEAIFRFLSSLLPWITIWFPSPRKGPDFPLFLDSGGVGPGMFEDTLAMAACPPKSVGFQAPFYKQQNIKPNMWNNQKHLVGKEEYGPAWVKVGAPPSQPRCAFEILSQFENTDVSYNQTFLSYEILFCWDGVVNSTNLGVNI